MPLELLELVLKNLSLVDHIYIPTVCKSWSNVPNHINEAKTWPWLMYCPKDDGQCKFIDPFYSREYSMDLNPMLKSKKLTLHFSKDGFALVSTQNRSLFLINPFVGTAVKLPRQTHYKERVRALLFNSSITSSDFILFGMQLDKFATWTPQENEWTFWRRCGMKKDLDSNFVFFNGEIHWLDNTGNLFIFDLKNLEIHVLVLSVDSLEGTEDRYLIEFEGELISVFHGTNGVEDNIWVYKLDQCEMGWTRMDDLGDLSLFLDRRTPVAKRAPIKSCANRMYLPKFDENSKHVVYYSVETGEYYPKVYDMTEPVNCVWIEPNLNS